MPDVTGRPRGGALRAHDVQAFPARHGRDVFVHGYPRGGALGAHDVQGRPAKPLRIEAAAPPVPPAFPTQFAGLRAFYGGSVHELCLVALADAPPGLGGRLTIDKNGTSYAVYLVETTDPNATPIRVRTTTGTKAVRHKN